MSRPYVSVVLLTRDEIATLPQVLEMLRRQETPFPFEILAIDSGSRDGSRELLASHSIRVTDIPPSEFHHSRTRNLGAELARGELLVWLAADAIPLSAQWLAQLTRPFGDPSTMGAYGRQVARVEHGPLQSFRLAFIYPAASCVRTAADAQRGNGRAYSFSDVNSCVRKTFWAQHRYPEEIPLAEDIAMAGAILDGGYSIAYVAEACVLHSHAFSAKQFFRRYYAHGAAYRSIGLGGESRGPRVRRDGLRYALSELSWCLWRHGLRWAMRSAAASAAKALGYWLGRNEGHLPSLIRRGFAYNPRADAGSRAGSEQPGGPAASAILS